MLSIFGPVPADQSTVFLVFTYTVFHYAAFVLLGLIAAMIVNLANREPSILLGFVVLFRHAIDRPATDRRDTA